MGLHGCCIALTSERQQGEKPLQQQQQAREALWDADDRAGGGHASLHRYYHSPRGAQRGTIEDGREGQIGRVHSHLVTANENEVSVLHARIDAKEGGGGGGGMVDTWLMSVVSN